MSDNTIRRKTNIDKHEQRGKVSQEDIEVLAALLIAFPQVSKITFDPERRGLKLVFLCQGPVSKSKREKLQSLYLQSIDAYLSLAKQTGSIIECNWETIDDFHSFHVERDVASLSTGELSLTVSLVTDQVPILLDLDDSLITDTDFSWSARFFLQEMLDKIKELECPKRLVALREGEKVLVFHK